MRLSLGIIALAAATQLQAAIPATPVMTVYQFNGPLTVPYYRAEGFSGAGSPAGSLTQGTSVIPCLVIRNGSPLTDSKGTPFVGFEIVVDPRKADRDSTASVSSARWRSASRLQVQNHHCGRGVQHVTRSTQPLCAEQAALLRPAAPRRKRRRHRRLRAWIAIVRAFHDSTQCDQANRSLSGRRGALEQAWEDFARANPRLGSANRSWPAPSTWTM